MPFLAAGLWIAFSASFIFVMRRGERRRSIADPFLLGDLVAGFLYLLMSPLLVAALIISLLAWPIPVALWAGFVISSGLGFTFGGKSLEGGLLNWLGILLLVSAIVMSILIWL